MQIANPKSLVVIGASQGGLRALQTLLAGLPGRFPWPVAIVLHRAIDADSGLAELLQKHSALPVSDALDKQSLLPGHVFLAPPDYHLLVDRDALALSTEAPDACARPSINLLFESAADACGAQTIAVVLTGASDDGARGAARVKAAGGRVIIEDPATAESSVMPAAALAAPTADHVLPVAGIAKLLAELAAAARPSHEGEGQSAIRNPQSAI